MPIYRSAQDVMADRPDKSAFREGDAVALAQGTYQGAVGVFLHLNADANWASIAEPDGGARSHPVAWLEHRL